jgi:hypothetical protein
VASVKLLGKTLVVTVAAAVATLLTHGVAAATTPNIVGKSYSDAKAVLSMAGLTPVTAGVIGDKTAQSDCKVIAQHDAQPGLQGWATADTTNGVFIGGDQPTLYAGPGFGNIPTAGRVFLTLACYAASDAAPGQATGTGDINTKKKPSSSS